MRAFSQRKTQQAEPTPCPQSEDEAEMSSAPHSETAARDAMSVDLLEVNFNAAEEKKTNTNTDLSTVHDRKETSAGLNSYLEQTETSRQPHVGESGRDIQNFNAVPEASRQIGKRHGFDPFSLVSAIPVQRKGMGLNPQERVMNPAMVPQMVDGRENAFRDLLPNDW